MKFNMTTIKIIETIYNPIVLYKKSNSLAQRALAGYMIKSGYVNDPLFGGAFKCLREIEHCMDYNEIYKLYSLVSADAQKRILLVAQMALDGKFDKFALSERECRNNIKNLMDANYQKG